MARLIDVGGHLASLTVARVHKVGMAGGNFFIHADLVAVVDCPDRELRLAFTNQRLMAGVVVGETVKTLDPAKGTPGSVQDWLKDRLRPTTVAIPRYTLPEAYEDYTRWGGRVPILTFISYLTARHRASLVLDGDELKIAKLVFVDDFSPTDLPPDRS